MANIFSFFSLFSWTKCAWMEKKIKQLTHTLSVQRNVCRQKRWTIVVSTNSKRSPQIHTRIHTDTHTIYFHNKIGKKVLAVVHCWLFHSVFLFLFESTKRIDSVTEQWPMRSNNFRFCHFIQFGCSMNAVCVPAQRKTWRECDLQMHELWQNRFIQSVLCFEHTEPFDVRKIHKKGEEQDCVQWSGCANCK